MTRGVRRVKGQRREQPDACAPATQRVGNQSPRLCKRRHACSNNDRELNPVVGDISPEGHEVSYVIS
ncbi:hypothetical protein DPMN_180960 [Dreissena polymorpha]|uniref:Uncharacterized protein n=1 Tax=Dreissena polymorpha TaxID=45954 RepID=A0A9D4DBF4_DREPO|nr:hypothetical protein DPMN_180960 [Dreissena polymorpha]